MLHHFFYFELTQKHTLSAFFRPLRPYQSRFYTRRLSICCRHPTSCSARPQSTARNPCWAPMWPFRCAVHLPTSDTNLTSKTNTFQLYVTIYKGINWFGHARATSADFSSTTPLRSPATAGRRPQALSVFQSTQCVGVCWGSPAPSTSHWWGKVLNGKPAPPSVKPPLTETKENK